MDLSPEEKIKKPKLTPSQNGYSRLERGVDYGTRRSGHNREGI